MYEDLIQRLEGKVFERPSCTPFDCGVFGLVGEAAAAIAALQTKNAEKDKEIERLQAKAKQWKQTSEENFASCEKLQAALTRMEAERDAANGYLEKIDGMFGTAYPNEILAVLDEWRGAQGDG